MTISRLLRHSLGGKNVSIAARHYVSHEVKRLRGIVDLAFAEVPGLKATVGALAIDVMTA